MNTVHAIAAPVNATCPVLDATGRIALATFRRILMDRGDFSTTAVGAVVAYVARHGVIDHDTPCVASGEIVELAAALEWARRDAEVDEDPRWDDTRDEPEGDVRSFPEPAHGDDEPDTSTPDEYAPGRSVKANLDGTRAVTEADWAEFGAWSSSLDFPAATNPDWLVCPVVRDFDREYEDSRVPMFGYE